MALCDKLTKYEVGTFEAGYRTFRTFYDGAGGFFPTNNVWMAAMPRALHVDRGRFHLGGTVNLPGKPVFTFRYTADTRDGRKNSTILGDTSFTGIPNYSQSALNPVSIARRLLDREEHVFLVGDGARSFALEAGFAEVEPAALVTERARARHEARLAGDLNDTVGACALDAGRDARGQLEELVEPHSRGRLLRGAGAGEPRREGRGQEQRQRVDAETPARPPHDSSGPSGGRG